jgi:micrococcal nuclease
VTTLGTYRVEQVVDGDTIELKVDGRMQKVRLIGMDTPEVVDPRKVVQCFGREASARAHEVLEGQTVRLEYDVQVGERDKYGRLLGYVFLPDGANYAEKMIRDGYAHEYTYQGQTYKYQATYKQAQLEAESASRGFWSESTCGGDTKQPAK